MVRKLLFISELVCLLAAPSGAATPLGTTRWTDPEPYGIFFNDYDPNFYTGFVPRVQDKNRIKVHLGRGNQLRVRMVLPDEAVDNYLLDQVAKHDLYKELIDKEIIVLTSNTAWEDYHARFEAEGLRELAKKKGGFIVFQADPAYTAPETESRELFGVTLEQTRNDAVVSSAHLESVACGSLTEEAKRDLLLGLIALKYTQSNSVGYALGGHSSGDVFATGAAMASHEKTNNISLDQVAAKHLGHKTRYASLVMGTEGGTGSYGNCKTLSHYGPGRPIPSLHKPQEIFNRLFKPYAGKSIEEIRAELKREASILDLMLEHSKSLKGKLGKADQTKMNEFLESVRALEQLARATSEPRPRRAPRARTPTDPNIQRVVDSLRQRLQTRVRITGQPSRGRIEVEYFGADDLARIAGLLLGDG